jgi:hypothetical protein
MKRGCNSCAHPEPAGVLPPSHACTHSHSHTAQRSLKLHAHAATACSINPMAVVFSKDAAAHQPGHCPGPKRGLRTCSGEGTHTSHAAACGCNNLHQPHRCSHPPRHHPGSIADTSVGFSCRGVDSARRALQLSSCPTMRPTHACAPCYLHSLNHKAMQCVSRSAATETIRLKTCVGTWPGPSTPPLPTAAPPASRQKARLAATGVMQGHAPDRKAGQAATQQHDQRKGT